MLAPVGLNWDEVEDSMVPTVEVEVTTLPTWEFDWEELQDVPA